MLEGILDEPADTRRECLVMQWSAGLDEPDQHLLDTALKSTRSARWLYFRIREMSGGELPYSISTFERHRNGTCTCRP